MIQIDIKLANIFHVGWFYHQLVALQYKAVIGPQRVHQCGATDGMAVVWWSWVALQHLAEWDFPGNVKEQIWKREVQ